MFSMYTALVSTSHGIRCPVAWLTFEHLRLPCAIQENDGAPLTHKQKRMLKKMKKAEEAAAKRAVAAAALQ